MSFLSTKLILPEFDFTLISMSSKAFVIFSKISDIFSLSLSSRLKLKIEFIQLFFVVKKLKEENLWIK